MANNHDYKQAMENIAGEIKRSEVRGTYGFHIDDLWGFDSATDEHIIQLGLILGRNMQTIRHALLLADKVTDEPSNVMQNEGCRARLDVDDPLRNGDCASFKAMIQQAEKEIKDGA